MKMQRLHLLFITLAVATLFISLTGQSSVSAQTNHRQACNDNSILSGLWTGVYIALGQPDKCAPSSNQTNADPAKPGRYVALGDSVAAGLGIQRKNTVSGSDPACGLSQAAYPFIVARQTDRKVTNLACSGATAGDLFTEQHLPNTSRDIEPQLDRAFADGTPGLITITAGANDMRWVDFARKCYASTCGTNFDNTSVELLRSTVAFKLNWGLQEISRRSSGNPPRTIVTGYYHPLSSACNLGDGAITTNEAQWMNAQLDALNQTIQQAVANHSFARYAAINFSGHELCGEDSWVQGMKANAPLHPNSKGQRAIANAIMSQL